MHTPVSDLDQLLRRMAPVLHPGVFVFVTLPAASTMDPQRIVACIREPEGLSVVMSEADAAAQSLAGFRVAWITLMVHSDLQAVGFTAAFATALGRAGISCNVVAGTQHDHLFVPHDRADAALAVLRELAGNRPQVAP